MTNAEDIERAMHVVARNLREKGKYVVCEYRGGNLVAVYSFDDKPKAEHKRTAIDLQTDGAYARILEPQK